MINVKFFFSAITPTFARNLMEQTREVSQSGPRHSPLSDRKRQRKATMRSPQRNLKKMKRARPSVRTDIISLLT